MIRNRCTFNRVLLMGVCALLLLRAGSLLGQTPALLRTAKSGPWSAADTWEGGKVPGQHARVQVREGHTVTYDVNSGPVIRSIHVAGTLTFAQDRDTRLDVGLIKIQAGTDASEDGFDCDAHALDVDPSKPRPSLLVGTPEQPMPAKHKAVIRLTYVEGLDKISCPAIVCCGGRMDLHGAPLSATWVKLGAPAKKGEAVVVLSEAVTGWKVGDKVIVTATQGDHGTDGTRRAYADPAAPKGKKKLARDVDTQTEERQITKIDGKTITLDRPLEFDHKGGGELSGAVAVLSRNVVVESADPKGIRGHTMYHRGSAGAISYAEFRHLGKENTLGRYSIHYHLCGNTMRGSYVIGASIWDSHNRWVTIHGTNFLVVRDCVGYQSVGHGFFLEDGTEVYNVLDRNLAVQAFNGKKLPKQVLPFDQNEGAGFWWTNSLNSFTRNSTCENDRYGYRFEATQTSAMKLTLPVLMPNGKREVIDVRTLPFIRFDDNEAACDGRYGFNLGEGVAKVGPDAKHPFIIRNMKIWQVHYAFRVQSPSVLVDGMLIDHADYGVYHPNYDNHVYKNLTIRGTNTEPFNRGHDDDSVQLGMLTVDGLTFEAMKPGGMTMVQISDHNPTGKAETHIRNLKAVGFEKGKRAVIDLGGGPRPTPKSPTSVPIYVHDYFGPGVHAKVVSTKSGDMKTDGLEYKSLHPLTGQFARVAEVKGIAFPKVLDPVDDLAPGTIITHVLPKDPKTLLVRGVTIDNGTVAKVSVNGQAARATRPNFAEWEVEIGVSAGKARLEARAEDAAGNVEQATHVVER